MPTKKSPSSPTAPKKPRVPKVSAEKKSAQKTPGNLKELRAEYFSLKMKHTLRELKEVHKLRHARRAVARFLTKLHNTSSHEKN